MSLAVAALIPVYNCAEHIGSVIGAVRAQVDDVLIVDDASTDATVEASRRAGARVVAHRRNRGKGTALRTGLGVLLGENWTHVLMLDGDGQHDPAEIPRFLEAAADAEFVLGNRLWNPSAIPPRRYWTNFVGTRALELMTGFPVEDSQCGYRLVAASLLRRMGLVGRRYAVDTEILVRARKLGARFTHVPVSPIYDGADSHFRGIADTVHIVFSAVRFKVDEGDLRQDPGPEAWRRLVRERNVLEPIREDPVRT